VGRAPPPSECPRTNGRLRSVLFPGPIPTQMTVSCPLCGPLQLARALTIHVVALTPPVAVRPCPLAQPPSPLGHILTALELEAALASPPAQSKRVAAMSHAAQRNRVFAAYAEKDDRFSRLLRPKWSRANGSCAPKRRKRRSARATSSSHCRALEHRAGTAGPPLGCTAAAHHTIRPSHHPTDGYPQSYGDDVVKRHSRLS